MSPQNLLMRNSGRLKFRTPWKVFGKPKYSPLMHYNCECCHGPAWDQVVGVYGRRGRRIVPVQWAWICEPCKKVLKDLKSANTK